MTGAIRTPEPLHNEVLLHGVEGIHQVLDAPLLAVAEAHGHAFEEEGSSSS